MNDEITCIGCGCSDSNACVDGCEWLVVDEDIGAGVCSNCPDYVEQFEDPDLVERREPGGLILPGDPDFHI